MPENYNRDTQFKNQNPVKSMLSEGKIIDFLKSAKDRKELTVFHGKIKIEKNISRFSGVFFK